MENKDLMIYNAVANVAGRVFETFDPVMFQPGKYDVPAVLAVIKKLGKHFQDAAAETAANEIVKIEIDTFVCSFRAVDSFELLKRLAAAYQIPTAHRAQFTKKADAASVAVSFRVFAGLKDLCSRVGKDNLRPSLNYICVDTKHRALIVSDARTLSAVPVPEMYVAPDAKETYLITPAVLKAGHGVCNIDVNGTATNGAAVSAVDEEIKYPNISRLLFAVPAEFITLGKKVFSELKKNISAAGKFGKVGTYQTPVILKADAGANEIEIIGYKEGKTETAQTNETRRIVVSLPQPVPFAFAVAVDPGCWGKVLAAEKMYLKDPFSPVCFVDETRRVFSVMCPGKNLNKTPFFDLSFSVSVAADSLPVDAVAGTFAPVQDAPYAPFEDEETAPAVPAVSEETKITYITKNYVPVITEEIRDAVAVAAEYKYIPYYINKYGVRCSREHTPVICAAELLLQRENLYIGNYALICGNGQTFAYIDTANDMIRVNYDVQETAAPVDEETQMYNDYLAAAVQDEETPAVADSVPAVSEDTPAVPAVAVDEETPAVDEETPAVDEETPAVDEETPAVANSRRRFRVWPWLIRAAAVLIAFILFAVNDAKKTPAVAVSVAADNETPAAVSADSLAAVLFAVPEDAQETNDAPAVAVSVAADNETPAVADKQPQTAKKQPQTRRKRARRAESCKQFVPDAPAVVSVADSLAADSVPAVLFAADSLAADSVPAVADSLATDSVPAVADSLANVAVDEETPAVDEETPAVDEETPQDKETAPAVPADSVPANSPSPAVPAVSGCPAAPVAVAAVCPYVIACFGN